MFAKIKKKRDQKLFEAYLAQMNLVNPKSISYDQVKSLNTLKNECHLLSMNNMVDSDLFLSSLKDFKVHYAKSNNSTDLEYEMNFGKFVNEIMPYDNDKYVFHNVLRDEELTKKIIHLIPVPSFIKIKKVSDLRISRLYAGGKHSGTNLHIHSQALNYLVKGKKLWVVFPYNSSNNKFVEQNNMQYGKVKTSTLKWFLDSHQILQNANEITGMKVFIQQAKEVVYIPSGSHHAVVNLENSLGITYSWV